MLIAGSSAPDFASPAEACNVAAALGLEVPAFDVNSACTSLLVQIHLLSLMDPTRLPDFVLLVAPDSLTKTVDYTDRSAAVLWGDAAAAAVVSTRVPGRARILGSTLASRPSSARQGGGAAHRPLLAGGPHGADVRDPASRARCYKQPARELRERRAHAPLRRPPGQPAHARVGRERCGIDRERHHTNVEWFGNTGAASSASRALDALGEVAAARRRGGGRRRRGAHLVELPGALRRRRVKYAEFRARAAFDQLGAARLRARRAGRRPARGLRTRLPLPPMLMLDRVDEISRERRARAHRRRARRAPRRLVLPVPLPGRSGAARLPRRGRRLAAARLLLRAGRAGLGLGARARLRRGRVLRARSARTTGCVRTEIDVRRYAELEKAGATIVIGDATLLVDGEEIYTIKRAQVGHCSSDIAYPDYPIAISRSRGGRMER